MGGGLCGKSLIDCHQPPVGAISHSLALGADPIWAAAVCGVGCVGGEGWGVEGYIVRVTDGVGGCSQLTL